MLLGEFWNQGETRAHSLLIYPPEMFPTDVLSIDLNCVCVEVCVYVCACMHRCVSECGCACEYAAKVALASYPGPTGGRAWVRG